MIFKIQKDLKLLEKIGDPNCQTEHNKLMRPPVAGKLTPFYLLSSPYDLLE